MGTLHLPIGKFSTIKTKSRPTVTMPARSGHAASSIFKDQFKKHTNTAPQGANGTDMPETDPKPELPAVAVLSSIRRILGLRPEKLAHPVSVIHPSRLPKVVRQAPRISEMERGDSPFRRRIMRLRRKWGLI